MNDWLDYKGSGSSRAYMGDTISHGAKTSVENARKMAVMRSSVKSAFNELLKLDDAITALGNQLYDADIPDIKTSNNAKAAALDSKYKNMRATAMHKYEQWKINYLYPTLKNNKKYLIDGGYLAINIKNVNGHPLCEDVYNYVNQELVFYRY